jgi:hypothetical protein
VQDSKLIGVSRPSDTSNDLYSFIDSFMDSGSSASTQESDNLCVSDLQKPMIFPINYLKEYSDFIFTNVEENPGNTGVSKGIRKQIDYSIIRIHNNNMLEAPEQITDSPRVDSSEKTTTTIMSMQNVCFVCSKPTLKYFSYGGQVCSSCRSFFHRAVTSKNNTLLSGKKTKACHMNPETKRCCKYCRF